MAQFLFYPIFRAFTAGGIPAPGALVYTYAAGSLTPLTTYQDANATIPNTNPVVCDSTGSADIRMGSSAYKIVCTEAQADGSIPSTPSGTIIFTVDNYTASAGGGGGGVNGVNSINFIASNPSITLAADSSGNVSDFSQAYGFVRLLDGQTDETATAVTLSVAASVNCTGTVNYATATPVAGQGIGYYAITAMTADTGSLTLAAIYNGQTYNVQINLVKARAGAAGTPGAGTSAAYLQLSLPSTTVFAYSDGEVPSWSGISGYAKVFSGTTDVTASCTFGSTASGLTGTINTAANTPVTGQPIGYYQVTAMSGNSGTLTITATYSGTTFTQTFSVSKILTGFQIVNSLPTTFLFVGRVVFLTTDNKLYRYTGSAWTPAVAATDITGVLTDSQLSAIAAAKVTGQLTASQIASIAATSITGQITTTQIANGSISTPLLAAGAVTTAQIAAGTIVAGNIAASAITATQLAANSVTSASIVAGTILGGDIAASTITGTNIAAGTVTANNIAANTITGNQILAGSITAAQIGVSSLSAISANVGTVTAGVLQSSSGNSVFNLNGGYIEFNNGTYMKVTGVGFGANSNYLEWYGPTQSPASNFAACTDALAIFYLKTDGTAFFGGATAAGAIVHTFMNPAGLTGNIEVAPKTGSCFIQISGGGGGGSARNSGLACGGGGGGGYCTRTISVTKGDVFTFTQGYLGPSGNYVSSPVNGTAGGSSSVSGTVTGGTVAMSATGGGGGSFGGAGGAAGTASGGTTNTAGQAGTNATPGLGGSSGSGAAGGSSDGASGSYLNGGGAGGAATLLGGNAGSGAPGQVQFTYS